ncbi:oxidoreductase [Loigolactobacillus jiayinensis]|uniref:Oxidoreductase n=1 Tax=Loigolactobacillus jiayinensis TaxID=2486016 RepID=A0ABW1RJM3_9LACO|nr:oxidoreductase [Loigolactobacillus jiayinensis]
MAKVWLVTGTSRGLGKALVETLLQQGEKVVATARQVTTIAAWAKQYPQQVLTLALDVTDKAQIETVIAQAVAHFGQIDVLVNNAGYGYFGAVEESDEAAVRAMFETNFWGLAAVMQTSLPQLRAQRQGLIINISSDCGLTTYPALGYYQASKFAVEGLSQTLAQEAAPLGIKLMLVEPGTFRTDWAGRSAGVHQRIIADYAATAGAAQAHSQATLATKLGSPVLAAQAIIYAANTEQPPLHLVLGADALAAVRQQLHAVDQDLEKWADVSSHTAFGDERYWK